MLRLYLELLRLLYLLLSLPLLVARLVLPGLWLRRGWDCRGE